MKPARRGLLRMLGAGALTGVARGTPGVAPGIGMPLPPMAPGTFLTGGDDEQRQKWRLLDGLARPGRRRQRREEIAAALRGGMPPHMAACHSWAPWFRAQRAAAWIEAREAEHDDWFTALRRRIVGDE